MKLQRTSAAALMVALGISATFAQQLPNPGFEDNWEDCIPWNSQHTTTVKGQTPKPWCISNVVTPGMSFGNASPYEKVAGNNSETAVKLTNLEPVSGQVIPGYITLGTTWSTVKVKLFSVVKNSADGGTWGGLNDFSYKPDVLALDYIRQNGESSTDKACVIAYTWKGSTLQKNVPANNAYSANLFKEPIPTNADITNRERNILGVSTSLGGDVTKSADFELISKIQYDINSPSDTWTTVEIPFEYLSDATPQMINVIFSSGSYFEDRSNLKKDDALTVDNVKLIYYSRLSSLKVNGAEVPEFAENKYEYTVDTPYSREAAIEYTVKGQSAKAEAVAYDDDNYTATVKVSNVDADSDGEASHSYVVKFAAPESETYEGIVTIYLNRIGLGSEPTELHNQHVNITSTGANTCEFALKNFSLDGEYNMGDIVVKNVKIEHNVPYTWKGKTLTATNKYTGSASNIVLDAGEDTEIHADVEISGMEDANRNMFMSIAVKWLTNGADDHENFMPIDVEFRTNDFDVVTGIDVILNDDTEATPRYYMTNGVEVKDATAPGLYIVRRGNTVSKVLVK